MLIGVILSQYSTQAFRILLIPISILNSLQITPLNVEFEFHLLEIKQEVYKWTEHNKQFSIKRTIKIILYRALRWVMCVSRK